MTMYRVQIKVDGIDQSKEIDANHEIDAIQAAEQLVKEESPDADIMVTNCMVAGSKEDLCTL